MGFKGQGGDGIFSSLVRKSRQKRTFKKRLEGTKEVSQVGTWKNFPGRRGSRHKGPVVEACVACLCNSKEGKAESGVRPGRQERSVGS